MNDSKRRFGIGSRLALASGALLASAIAFAQDQPAGPPPPAAEEAEDLDYVVVTGTSIKGVAPIGSNLVSVGVDELEKSAATNLSTLVNTIPALTTNGSLAQGENLWSFYSPQIHQLGGSSSNTTLVVIDGMRMPGGGAQFSQTDPNIIPTSAMQAVDVLADGASSVYGSDAVAGWVGVPGIGVGLALLVCSLEFVGAHERDGWKLAETLTPIAYVVWSLWLVAAGIALLV